MKNNAKKFVKMMFTVLALSSMLLTACGNNDTSTNEDTTSTTETATSAGSYSTGVDQTVLAGDWFPQWQFFKTISPITWMQTGEDWDMTLDVDGEGNYTLTSEIKPYDTGVIEGDASYHHAKTIAVGTYTQEGDQITIAKPTHVTYEMQYGEFMEAYASPWSFNDEPGNYGGAWDSNDISEVLDIVPVTVFTVDGDKIVDFVCEGIEVVVEDTHAQEEVEAVDLGDSLFQQVSNGGATYLDFYADQVYEFTFPDQNISETGTFTFEDGVLVLTTPNGIVCEPQTTETENVYLYDFKSDLNEALGGKFEVNIMDFETAISADAEVVEEVSLGDSLFQQVSDGGSTFIDFYAESVYVFSYPDRDITENGTWSYIDGVLVLTTPNGVVCEGTATETDNVMLFDFKSDLNAALGGKFAINMSDFDAAVAQ